MVFKMQGKAYVTLSSCNMGFEEKGCYIGIHNLIRTLIST